MAVEANREDFLLAVEPGIDIFVRRVLGSADAVPVVLVHGARVPGLASFDLDVPEGSLVRDLVDDGHPTYVFDARGYGGSTRLAVMNEPPQASATLTRSNEVVRDLIGVVEEVRRREQVPQVALVGWATGGMWAGHYASLYPERVSHVVFYNTLYGGHDGHLVLGRGSASEDPDRPGRFAVAAVGNYRFNTAEELLPSWDGSIPTEDLTEWRHPRVAAAYVEAALASDPTSAQRTPASFRAPTGAIEDSYLLATGHQVYDAATITGHVLILRTERDFWSRPEDAVRLEQDLHRAASVRTVLIPRATHYVHLDRPEVGRAQFLAELRSHLSGHR